MRLLYIRYMLLANVGIGGDMVSKILQAIYQHKQESARYKKES